MMVVYRAYVQHDEGAYSVKGDYDTPGEAIAAARVAKLGPMSNPSYCARRSDLPKPAHKDHKAAKKILLDPTKIMHSQARARKANIRGIITKFLLANPGASRYAVAGEMHRQGTHTHRRNALLYLNQWLKGVEHPWLIATQERNKITLTLAETPDE